MSGISILFLCVLVGALTATPERSYYKKPCSSSSVPVHQYYKELGCKPITHAGKSCPYRYDCSHLENRDKSKCYNKGKPLEIGEETVSGEIFPGSCLSECRCISSNNESSATLQCTQEQCAPQLNPIPQDCVRTFPVNRCCPNGILCPADIKPDTAKCVYGNTTYFEGQQFYPADAPCTKCTCMQGFDGTFEGPWCEAVSCGIEMNYSSHIERGCAPVFTRGSCCPTSWRCPVPSDRIAVGRPYSDPGNPADTCKWGNLTLMDQYLLTFIRFHDGNCQYCGCDVPPHVTCENAICNPPISK